MSRISNRARRASLAALLGAALVAAPALVSPAWADTVLPGNPPSSGTAELDSSTAVAPLVLPSDGSSDAALPSADQLAVQANSAAQAEADATLSELPDTLKAAIQRDLGMTPEDWVEATRLASEGSNLVAQVREAHPQSYAGAEFDPATGRTTLSVTTAAAAEYAQSVGLAVALVPWSAAQLKQVAKEFYQQLTPAQQATVVSMTPQAETQTVAVRVKVAEGADLAEYHTGELPITLVLAAPDEVPSVKEAAAGAANQPLPDGSGIFLNSTCSLGFGAADPSGQKYWLTAGHCAQDGGATTMNSFVGGQVGARIGDLKWYQFGSKNMNSSNWPGSSPNADISAYTVIPNSGFEPTAQVNTYGSAGVSVDGVVNPTVGMPVCRSGLTTGWQCGTIKATDQQPLVTLDVLPEARPVDAFDMTMCSLPGDSGGPVMAGNLAVGTLSAVTNLPSPTDPTKCDASATNGGQGQHTFGVSINSSLAGTDLTLLQRVKVPAVESLRAGDTVTLGALTLSGTGTPGDTVNVALNQIPVGTAKVDAKGVWSVQGAKVTQAGDNTLTVQAQRDAVNRSAPVNLAFKSTAAVATVTSPLQGSSLLPEAQAVAGKATAGASVAVLLNGAPVGTAIADTNGNWTLAGVPFALGSATITAVPSLGGSAGAPATSQYQVNPVLVAFQTGRDAVYSGTQVVTGTATPGASVKVSLNGAVVATVQADSQGGWQVNANVPAGAATLRADATVSSVTAAAELKLTVNRLAAPMISSPATGTQFTAGTRTISGTALAGSDVTVLLNGTTLGTVRATANGSWTTPNVLFNAGAVTLTAYSSIQSGRIVSSPARAQLQVAARPVAKPVVAQTLQPTDLVIDKPKSTDARVTPGMYKVSGTAPVGSKVTVTLNNKVVGVANVVSTSPDAKTAPWSLDVTLVPGANVVQAAAAMGGQQVQTEMVLSALAEAAESAAAASTTAPSPTASTGAAAAQTTAAAPAQQSNLTGTFWVSMLGGMALLIAAAVMFVRFRRGSAETKPDA